jgi:hypothetical protein
MVNPSISVVLRATENGLSPARVAVGNRVLAAAKTAEVAVDLNVSFILCPLTS